MYQRQAKLDALNTIAVMRGVFPDEWVVAHPNSQGMTPKIIQNADGKTGVRGVIQNGQIDVIYPQINQNASLTLDRLERNARLSAGIPAEWGGESGSNIRTAKRGDSVLSEAVDPDIQETQEIFAASMEAEIRRGIAIQKAYYGSKPTIFLMGMNGKIEGPPDYTPDEAFETDLCRVSYPLPGSDANQMAVMIGQKIGIGEMSVRSAMEMDPLIRDPELETARIHVEGIRKALLSGLEQQAVQGQLDPNTISRIAIMMGDGRTPLEEAVMKVHEEMQKEQADKQNAQPQQGAGVPNMGGVPGQPGPAGLSEGMGEAQPEDQPGMAPTPPPDQAQMAQASSPISAPPQGLSNLQDLLGSLHQTSAPPAMAQ